MTDSTDNSQQAKETIEEEKKPGIIRKAAVIPILLLSISSWFFFNFFFDSILTNTLKRSAEALYGSTVDIQDLKTSFSEGSIQIGTLAFSDKKNLSNNKLEIQNINFSLIVSELLKKKVIVDKVNVGEVLFDTKRKSQAVLIKENEAQKNSAFILKEKIKENSTDFLNFTTDQSDISTSGIEKESKDIEKRINALKGQDLSYIKRNLNEINNLYKKIKKEKNPLKKIKYAGTFSKKIKETKNKIKKDKKNIEKEIKEIKTKIINIKNTSKEKLGSARNLFDKKKLEELIIVFTKNKLNQYISPWMNKIDEYKQYLPKTQTKTPSPNKKEEAIKKTGRVIHFTKSEDLPSFLVKNLNLRAKKDRTNFQLSLKNLTNKYNSRIKNSSGKFKFIDPGSGNLNGNMLLDPNNFLFEISSMGRKVTDVWLLKNKNLNFKITEGIESWDFKYQKKTTNVEIIHSHNFQDTRIELSSSNSNKVINNILSNTAKKIHSIQLSFGHNQKARSKYLVKTTLVDDLPKALTSSMNQELESVKKKANNKVKEKINAEKKRLQKRLDQEKKKILGKLKVKLPKLKI